MSDLLTRIRKLNILDVAIDVLPFEIVESQDSTWYRTWCPNHSNNDYFGSLTPASSPNFYICPDKNFAICYSCDSTFSALILPYLTKHNEGTGISYLENKLGFSRENSDEMEIFTREFIHNYRRCHWIEEDNTQEVYDEIISLLIKGGEDKFPKYTPIDFQTKGLSYFKLHDKKSDEDKFFAASGQFFGKQIGFLGNYLGPPFYNVHFTEKGIKLGHIDEESNLFRKIEKWVGKSSPRRLRPLNIKEIISKINER